MLIDSHAHLNFEEFKNDWPAVIDDCQKNDISMINVGSQLATSRRAVEIAEIYPTGVWAAIGLHPIHVFGSSFHPEEFVLKKYRELLESSKKIVALGETGLDFFHDQKTFSKQKEVFLEHINLAKEFSLPLILHSRNSQDGKENAYDEILKILKKEKVFNGVIHCYSGTVAQALAFQEQGFYIGFTGIITFDKTGILAQVAGEISLDRILIETDCPYLAPEPFRGQRNQPQYVKYVAEKIAKIRNLDYNIIVEKTANNAKNLFKLS